MQPTTPFCFLFLSHTRTLIHSHHGALHHSDGTAKQVILAPNYASAQKGLKTHIMIIMFMFFFLRHMRYMRYICGIPPFFGTSHLTLVLNLYYLYSSSLRCTPAPAGLGELGEWRVPRPGGQKIQRGHVQLRPLQGRGRQRACSPVFWWRGEMMLKRMAKGEKMGRRDTGRDGPAGRCSLKVPHSWPFLNGCRQREDVRGCVKAGISEVFP